MAAPAFRSVSAFVAGTLNLTPAEPTGSAEDDILVMLCETRMQDTPPSPPSGWTEAAGSPNDTTQTSGGDNAQLSVFWIRRGASAPSYTTTGGSSPYDHIAAQVAAFSGCITSGDPWDATAMTQDGWTGSKHCDAVTTNVADTLIVLGVASGKNATDSTNFFTWANANLTSVTEHMDQTNTVGDGGGVGMASGVKATAGDTGTTTFTSDALPMVQWTGALKPPAAAISHGFFIIG